MRQWSYNNTDSIYIFNKRQKEKAVQPANVNERANPQLCWGE